jgi:hypothetical protein
MRTDGTLLYQADDYLQGKKHSVLLKLGTPIAAMKRVLAFESPSYSKNVNSWWSEVYGEGPAHVLSCICRHTRMGLRLEKIIILYSTGCVGKNVVYENNRIEYDAVDKTRDRIPESKVRTFSGYTEWRRKQKYSINKLSDGGTVFP